MVAVPRAAGKRAVRPRRVRDAFLPAATKLMSEKGGMVVVRRRSRQKSRLLPAATKLMSEKGPQATFSNRQED
jgi:hypothetical protein